MSQLLEDLKKYEADYNKGMAQPVQERKQHDAVPPGNYEAKIIKAELDKSKNGALMFVWQLCIEGGQHNGRHIWKREVLEFRALYVAQDLKLCGREDIKITDLLDKAEELSGLRLKISIREKGEHLNVYFNELLPGSAPAQPAAAPAVAGNPFGA
jgi:hypothetical protein